MADNSVRKTDLSSTPGYLVVDCYGHRIGAVECALPSGSPMIPDAISLKAGFLGRQRALISADNIDAIDPVSRVISLRIDRRTIKTLSCA